MTITRRAMLSLVASVRLRPASLQYQSMAIILDRAIADPAVSYLLTDCIGGREICSRWENERNPVPVGSLVKPFTALAYGETHAFRFPVSVCVGTSSHCWLPAGHGRIDIRRAIAYSCNAYFLELARDLKWEALLAVVERYGLGAPDADAGAGSLIGLGTGWRIPPIGIVRAYSEMVARWSDPGVREIFAGMALSARLGTGRGVGAGAFAKTGTAPCVHESKEKGDGYVVALYPADAPRCSLLVREHGVPGARAAWVCGKIRRALG